MKLLEMLEKIFKPIIMPLISKLKKPVKVAKTLPKKAIKYVQDIIKGFLAPPKSRNQYILIGRRFYSKKLMIIIFLIIVLLIYFIFISPPAFVNKWLSRTPNLYEQSDHPLTYSGAANVYNVDDELIYKGELLDGLYEGKGKLYASKDKLIYDGDFKKGRKEGTGELYDPNNQELIYKGLFAEDKYAGSGSLFYPNRQIQYEGEFKNGKFGGQGTTYDPQGHMLYIGEYIDGQYSGNGKSFNDQGILIFDGQFLAGKYHGTGKLHTAEGSVRYEGGFQNGMYAGDGMLYNSAGLITYKGQFAANKYHGIGELFDELGNLLYAGEFANGIYQGTGKLYDVTGFAKYDGKFSNGKYEGLGTLLDSDENMVFKGYFHEDGLLLEAFLGLFSSKIEEILGKPTDIVIVEDNVVTAANDELEATDGEDIVQSDEDLLFEEPLLPATVDYNYAPLQLTFEMSIPLSDQEQPTVSMVRVWNPTILKLLEAQGIEPFNLDKSAPMSRSQLTDGDYEKQYYSEHYGYKLRYNAIGALIMLEVSRI